MNLVRINGDASEAADEIRDRLAAEDPTVGDGTMSNFAYVFRDAGGALLGGCAGEIAFRTAHVSYLWVDERLRGLGYGGRLLEALELDAVSRGLARVHLETRSRGAKAFYEKRGYATFGELPDYADGQSLFFLEKRIGQAARTRREAVDAA